MGSLEKQKLSDQSIFIAELIYSVQNYKYVRVNSLLETITIRMIDYKPVGKSIFMISGNTIGTNFERWAEGIYKNNFTEISV